MNQCIVIITARAVLILVILVLRNVIRLRLEAQTLLLTEIIASILEVYHHVCFGGPIICKAAEEGLALCGLQMVRAIME
jgi:hypothetical protein